MSIGVAPKARRREVCRQKIRGAPQPRKAAAIVLDCFRTDPFACACEVNSYEGTRARPARNGDRRSIGDCADLDVSESQLGEPRKPGAGFLEPRRQPDRIAKRKKISPLGIGSGGEGGRAGVRSAFHQPLPRRNSFMKPASASAASTGTPLYKLARRPPIWGWPAR